MSTHDWTIFGSFALMEIGLSLFSVKIAATVGLVAMLIIILKNPTFILNSFPSAVQGGDSAPKG